MRSLVQVLSLKMVLLLERGRRSFRTWSLVCRWRKSGPRVEEQDFKGRREGGGP